MVFFMVYGFQMTNNLAQFYTLTTRLHFNIGKIFPATPNKEVKVISANSSLYNTSYNAYCLCWFTYAL